VWTKRGRIDRPATDEEAKHVETKPVLLSLVQKLIEREAATAAVKPAGGHPTETASRSPRKKKTSRRARRDTHEGEG